MRSLSKRTLAFGFAAILAVLVALVAATMGIGKLSVPEGAIAFVDDVEGGELTQDELDAAIEEAAGATGAEAPTKDSPEYGAVLVPAVSDLLLTRWVRGEADERGIEITEREVDVELQTIIEQQLGGQKEFEQVLEESGLTEEEARERVELQLMTQCIQDQVIPQDPEAEVPAAQREGCQGEETLEITEDEIQEFYDDNESSFQTPETREFRTLLNPDEEKAQEAADLLAEDGSAESWKDVTKELSTEEETIPAGGLRPAAESGTVQPLELDEAVFAAEEGEVIGPIETDNGFYVAQVEAINEAVTQELDEATSDQIRQQLVTQEQQQAVTDFQDDFIAKWQARTVCSESILGPDEDGTIQSQLAERCSNFQVTDDGCLGDDEGEKPAPNPETGEVPDEPPGCPAFVPSRPVIPPIPLPQEEEDPLLATPSGTLTPLPQGPQPPPEDEAELPPGTQQLPPGTLPPGAAPPGTAPPGTAPPGTAPPGTPPG